MNDDHPSAEAFAEYLSGNLSPTEKTVIDEHCIDCAECRGKIGATVRSLARNDNEELEGLFDQGNQAARSARTIEED